MAMENNIDDLPSQPYHLNEILSAVTDMMPDRHFIVNEKGIILSLFGNRLSEQFYDLTDYKSRPIADITTAENTKKTLVAIDQAITTEKIVSFEASSKLSDVRILRPNAGGPNSKQWFEIRVSKLTFLIDNQKVVILSIRNITDRKLSEIQLIELTVTDSLTQLFNRRYARDELTRCLQRFLRYKTDTTVLLLDIDFFKKINDNYGHDIGDLALIELSKLLQKSVRNVDTVARIGGEEFLIIMPDALTHTMQPFIERLTDNIKKLRISTATGELSMTVSGGLSQFTESDNTIETLLKRIDIALYNSKNEGRNRITVA